MAKKNKVPKKIAGVKLPKPLRRGLRDLAASQNGREVLTEALAAAGTALAATQAKPAAKSGKLGAGVAPNADSESETPRNSPAEARAATVAALEDAARSFTDTLRRRGVTETPSVTTPPSAATH
jgi:hypothetical protein